MTVIFNAEIEITAVCVCKCDDCVGLQRDTYKNN